MVAGAYRNIVHIHASSEIIPGNINGGEESKVSSEPNPISELTNKRTFDAYESKHTTYQRRGKTLELPNASPTTVPSFQIFKDGFPRYPIEAIVDKRTPVRPGSRVRRIKLP